MCVQILGLWLLYCWSFLHKAAWWDLLRVGWTSVCAVCGSVRWIPVALGLDPCLIDEHACVCCEPRCGQADVVIHLHHLADGARIFQLGRRLLLYAWCSDQKASALPLLLPLLRYWLLGNRSSIELCVCPVSVNGPCRLS